MRINAAMKRVEKGEIRTVVCSGRADIRTEEEAQMDTFAAQRRRRA